MRIEPHARSKMAERGVSEQEVERVLTNGIDESAKYGRRARSLVFPWGKTWGRKVFAEKKVLVIYVEENHETVVVTVYAFYGKWT